MQDYIPKVILLNSWTWMNMEIYGINQINKPIPHDGLKMTERVLCQMTDPYFEDDQQLATKP